MTTWLRLARWVAALELPYVVLIAPALLMPTPARMLVLAGIPVIWLAARSTGHGWVARTPFNLALWLMLAMVGVSLYATPDLLFSLSKVAGIILGMLMFWALSRWLATHERLRLGVLAFAAAGGVLAVAGLIGVPLPTKFPVLAVIGARIPQLISGIPGAEGGFNPNGVAGGLTLLIPVQVAGLLAVRSNFTRPHVIVQALLVLLTSFTLLMMQSRTAWLGVFAGLLVVMLMVPRLRRSRPLLALAALLVVVAGLAISRIGEARDQPLNAAVSLSQREELWSKGLDAIRDAPMTGTGMNMFRRLIPLRYPTSTIESGYDATHAHNHLVQAALDLGLPGLIGYVAVWLIAGVLLLRVIRFATDDEDRSLAAGLAGALTAYFIFGMADTIAFGAKVGILFWMLLALVAAVHRLSVPKPEPAAGL